MSYFYFTFLSDYSISNLLQLSLNNTSGLNFYALFPAISKITFLSIENCSLDLNKTLGKLSKMKFDNLTALNLSKNQCKDPLQIEMILPNNLKILVLDSIEWGENCLTSLLKIINDNFHGRGLKLSMANTNTSKSEWMRLFNTLLLKLRVV